MLLQKCKKYFGLLLLFVLFLFLCACASEKKVVLTTGFSEGEIFKIDREVCTKSEVMVYLTNMQNGYESVYGEQIWDTQVEDSSLAYSLKETVLARIARVKVMKLMAKDKGVVLTNEEKEIAKQAGEEYYNSLNETEISAMDVNLDTIVSLYTEYALADKVYQYLIQDVNPEISDDEARTITVSQILIKTYHVNSDGSMEPYSQSAKEEAYKEAQQVLALANSGEDFNQLIIEYNEDTKSSYSFRKGEMSSAYEEAAFSLETDEISSIVETEFGYCIMKCISTFDREQTDANKIKIVDERKKEAFQQEYEKFLGTLTGYLNKRAWEQITLIHDDNVKTANFFDVYEKYFTNY